MYDDVADVCLCVVVSSWATVCEEGRNCGEGGEGEGIEKGTGIG